MIEMESKFDSERSKLSSQINQLTVDLDRTRSLLREAESKIDSIQEKTPTQVSKFVYAGIIYYCAM